MTKYGDFCVEKVSNREDEYFLFDSKYANEVAKHTWCNDGVGYPCANVGGKVIRLHLFVMNLCVENGIPKGLYIDHINQNKMDNRLCNLRIVTPTGNHMNLPLRAGNTSGATGVSLDKRTGKYRAYITVCGKQRSLGQYWTVQEAAKARQVAEQELGFTHRQNIAIVCEALKENIE